MNPTQRLEYLDSLKRRSISAAMMHRTTTAEPEARPAFADYSEQLAWERKQAEDAAAEIEQSKTPRRSAMTTKAKADYIGKHGGAAYLALPW